MRLTNAQRQGAAPLLVSDRVDADDMAAGDALGVRAWPARSSTRIPPSRLAAARRAGVEPGTPVVTLATAHPAKFPDAVERATGHAPAASCRASATCSSAKSDARACRATFEAVTDYIAEHAHPSP